ncbi:hypothetical protein PtA15_18A208 [Puccinia triticina]|uniref:Uncharacterized protein n=1 Tax=Puccinia triticina TaxID=208348 RepID=A0ABY7D8B5_9BASI|nr:uncharacterized protein PtA15_18A208 [Puccinia triticina]WAQ93150.1 hypothetical protein PtA15_18A208 [Puccinia triticina]
MASSFIPPKSRPHHYQPILPSRYPSSHFNSKQPDQPSVDNPRHFSASLVTRLMSPPAQPPGPFNGPGSFQDRLAKLEGSLPAMHDAYQREISSLRNEVESLKTSQCTFDHHVSAPHYSPGHPQWTGHGKHSHAAHQFSHRSSMWTQRYSAVSSGITLPW